MNRIKTRYKNLKRYKKIGEVLVKYGYTFAAEQLRKKGYLPNFVVRKNKDKISLTPGQRMRMACEELGPTFIKLGQIMSTRRDIFPDEIVNELSKLQDNVVPFPFDEARKVLEGELGKTIEETFQDFNPIPIAAASIGQAYEAVLQSGENVVVKIQRPNIKKIIERDMDILYNLAKVLDEHLGQQKPYNLLEIVEEFSRAIYKELDYSLEGRNAEKFALHFQKDSRIHIPKVFWDYTSEKALTMERVYGVKIINIDELKERGWDLKQIATIGAHSFMKQVFIHGFFHGDPHPGNMFAMGSNQIAFIDFGIVGYLDKNTMNFITNLFTAAARRDVEKVVNTLGEMDAIGKDTNLRRLKEDVSYMINQYYHMPLKKINIGEVVKQLMEMAYINQIKLPSQFTMLLKSIITLEGGGKLLYPDFSLSSIAKDFIKDIYIHRLNPANVLGEIKDYSEEILYSIKYLPKQMRILIRKLENNEVKIQLEDKEFISLRKELTRMTNRLSLSLILSAIIVGSSLFMQSNVGPLLWGVSMFGIIGYSLASIIGMTIVLATIIEGWRKTQK